MKHILIDYENIRPKFLSYLQNRESFHIWLFLGKNQQKNLPLDLVESLLLFNKENIHIIKMHRQSKNLLDHYLSFHLGKISEMDASAEICILSKDTGYDVLIEQVNLSFPNMHIIRENSLQYVESVWGENIVTIKPTDKPAQTATEVTLQSTNLNVIEKSPESVKTNSPHTDCVQAHPHSKNIIHGYEWSYQKNTRAIVNSTVAHTSKKTSDIAISPHIINQQFKFVLNKMREQNTFLPRYKHNFYSALYKGIEQNLDYQFDDITTKKKQLITQTIYQKLLNNQFIVEQGQELIYQVSNQDILKHIQNTILKNKPKNLSAFNNVLNQSVQLFDLELNETKQSEFLDYLVQKQLIQITNNKIIYLQDDSQEHTGFLNSYNLVLQAIRQCKAKPNTQIALSNWIGNKMKDLDETTIQKIIQFMLEKQKIQLAGKKVSYCL